MEPTTIATILLGLLLVQTAGILYLRWLDNPAMFKDNKNLKPINSSHGFFGGFNGFYNFLDSIPYLRRSGTANEFDFLKAAVLTVVPVLLLEVLLQRPSLFVVLAAADVMLFLVNVILLAHPLMKRLGGKR